MQISYDLAVQSLLQFIPNLTRRTDFDTCVLMNRFVKVVLILCQLNYTEMNLRTSMVRRTINEKSHTVLWSINVNFIQSNS